VRQLTEEGHVLPHRKRKRKLHDGILLVRNYQRATFCFIPCTIIFNNRVLFRSVPAIRRRVSQDYWRI
jgi:hypothetical protein